MEMYLIRKGVVLKRTGQEFRPGEIISELELSKKEIEAGFQNDVLSYVKKEGRDWLLISEIVGGFVNAFAIILAVCLLSMLIYPLVGKVLNLFGTMTLSSLIMWFGYKVATKRNWLKLKKKGETLWLVKQSDSQS
ncbi:MAG: hypothetical protein ACOX2M_03535 [Fastidiosipilaceae bacterium]|jgi:hypothetical protein